MIRLSPARRTAVQRFAPPLLVLLSVALIVLSKADSALVGALRRGASEFFSPALGLLSRPIEGGANLVRGASDWVEVYRRNEQLLRDNRRLLAWRQAALALAAQNAELRGLLKLVPEHALSYLSARVIADSGGAYAQSLLIDAGSADGVRRGEAVLGEGGLVGRIAGVGRHVARVLLLTDFNSRIPVFVEGKEPLRAILAGDNSSYPVLRFLPAKAPVEKGEQVVTSGIGGLFPPNLPIGVVSGVGGAGPRVAPYARVSETAYVRVVDYGLEHALPALAANGARGARPRSRSGASRER